MGQPALLNHELGHAYEHYLSDRGYKSVSHEYSVKSKDINHYSDDERRLFSEISERIIIGKYETPFNIRHGGKIRYTHHMDVLPIEKEIGLAVDWRIWETWPVD